MPKLEGQQYSSFKASFEWMEGEVKKVESGMTKSKFEVGKEFDLIIEKRTGKTSGKEYNYFLKEKTQEFGTKGKGFRDPIGTLLSTGMSYALDLYLIPPFNEAKIEDVYKGLINPMLKAHTAYLTDREKDFVSYAMSYAIRIYKDEHLRKKFQGHIKTDGTKVEDEIKIVVMLFHAIVKNMLDVNKTL